MVIRIMIEMITVATLIETRGWHADGSLPQRLNRRFVLNAPPNSGKRTGPRCANESKARS
jgi:hypothetical protein